jgi:ABC-type branched-subunit amino acid transport system ATPase component
VLSVQGVSKSFGGVHALRDVTVACNGGEILGLIGPNGAGKSTLVNAISGVLRPSRGRITLGSEDLTGRGPEYAARQGVGRTFQNLRLFAAMTARQNVEVAHITCRHYRPDSAAAIDIDALMAEYGLDGVADRPAGTLPYGQQRRLEIVRALALGPRLLLLDEPAAGMNDYESAELAHAVQRIRERTQAAVIVIDHDLRFIMSVCDRICVLDMGEVVAIDAPTAIRANPKVIDIYLGQMN